VTSFFLRRVLALKSVKFREMNQKFAI